MMTYYVYSNTLNLSTITYILPQKLGIKILISSIVPTGYNLQTSYQCITYIVIVSKIRGSFRSIILLCKYNVWNYVQSNINYY